MCGKSIAGVFRRAISIPWLKITILLLIPIVAILLPVEYIDGQGVSLCVYTNITGEHCWGCGITRAFVCLMQLKVQQAWQYNHLIVLVAPVLLWIWARGLVVEFKKLGLFKNRTIR